MGPHRIYSFLNAVYEIKCRSEAPGDSVITHAVLADLMEIPALFASHADGGLAAWSAWFEGTRPMVSGGPRPFDEAASALPRTDQRMPAVVADLDSLASGTFREKVVKEMRVRGRDIWLMTWIETADDLFDAFNTTAEIVLGPCHAAASDADLEDMLSVSDSFVPVVFVSDGEAIVRKGRRTGVYDTLSRLTDMGYYRTCVLDTDGSVDWEKVMDSFPSAVPFTRRPPSSEAISGMRICPA